MKVSSLSLALVVALAVSASLHAADDVMTDATKDRLVKSLGITRDNIRPSPIAGLAEIQHGHDFGYVTQDGKYLLRGDLVSIDTGEEITENRRRIDRLAVIKEIGEKNLIEFAPPAPLAAKYTVTVFTDVDCGYCRKLHSEIAEYNAKGIAIRYAFFPRSGPNTDSWRSAEAVWCSADQRGALTKAKQGQTIKLAGKTCDNPVAKEYELAGELGVHATPMLLLPNGDLYPGYLPPSVLAAKLAQIDLDAKAKAKG